MNRLTHINTQTLYVYLCSGAKIRWQETGSGFIWALVPWLIDRHAQKTRIHTHIQTLTQLQLPQCSHKRRGKCRESEWMLSSPWERETGEDKVITSFQDVCGGSVSVRACLWVQKLHVHAYLCRSVACMHLWEKYQGLYQQYICISALICAWPWKCQQQFIADSYYVIQQLIRSLFYKLPGGFSILLRHTSQNIWGPCLTSCATCWLRQEDFSGPVKMIRKQYLQMQNTVYNCDKKKINIHRNFEL